MTYSIFYTHSLDYKVSVSVCFLLCFFFSLSFFFFPLISTNPLVEENSALGHDECLICMFYMQKEKLLLYLIWLQFYWHLKIDMQMRLPALPLS